MIKIERYNSGSRKEWDDFLSLCKNATFLFNRSYMDYHKDRFHDSSFFIYDGNRLVALFPANKRDDAAISSHDGLTYGGLLVRKDEYSENSIRYFSALLKYCSETGIRRIIIKPIPHCYCTAFSDETEYALFLTKATVCRVDLHSIIDLQINPETLYQRRRRAGIRKAVESGVKVEEAEDFEQFWQEILIPNLYKRFGITPVHSLEEIKQLREDNPGCIRQFNAYCEDRIMCGCTIFEMPQLAHAQYFSGCDEGRKNGALDYLIHYLITRVFSNKRFFSFGNSNIDHGRKLNKGLLDWKEGFGARSITHRFYELETDNYPLIEQAFL